jgi:ABC-type oligopeptide transport system ATPase subunit
MSVSISPPLIEVKKLDKSFSVPQPIWWKAKKQLHVLKDIELTIGEGEIVGLVGESGSGKSTLGECIGGLQGVPVGTVFFRGQDVATLSGKSYRAYRRAVQFIFQDPVETLNPRLTVEQIIAEPMIVSGVVKGKKQIQEAVYQLLEDVGLDAVHASAHPARLSGGQCQRVAIARALSVKPSLLICDEAVSALDLSVQATILNLLSELQQKYQISQLFISHDLHVVRYLAHRVAVIHQGSIVEQGQASYVLDNPKHTYTQALVQSSL